MMRRVREEEKRDRREGKWTKRGPEKWSKKEEPRECRTLSCVGKRSWGKGSQAQGLERFRVGVKLRSAESSLDSPKGTC